MDTKKLFIKTQTNLINWAIVVSLILSSLTLLSLFKTTYTFNSIASATLYTLISALLIRVRLKLEVKAALSALVLFAVQFAFYLVTFFSGLPKMIALLKNVAETSSSYFIVIFSTLIGYGFFILCGYLYYKVYKAVQLINVLNAEESSIA